MKIACDALKLSEACQNVERAVSTKSSIPAIEGIFLKAENEVLYLAGYDLEVGINTVIDAKIEEAGSIILNARLLCDILRRLPDSKVVIEADERQLTTIRSGAAEYSLVGISSEEYPELPSVTGGFPVVIAQNLLKNMIRQTIFAVAVNDSKPVHTGIKFVIGDKKIRLIAVDGYRLAMRTEPMEYIGDTLEFVVPSKTLSEVMKLLKDDDSAISIGVGKRHIVFEIGNYSVISRLLDGEFLDYNAAIPTMSTTTARVNTRLVTDSVERTSLLITERLKSPIRCIFDEGSVKISCVTSIGRAFDQFPAIVEGKRVEIGFNNRYLLDALHVVESDEVKIELNGPLSPMKIVPLEGDGFLFLVLPVRLKNESKG